MTAIQRNGIPKSPFSEWFRAHPELDSRTAKLSIIDGDWIVHQFAERPDGKYVQNLMCIEEKSCRADVTEPQRDTLNIFAQILDTVLRVKRKRSVMRGRMRGRQVADNQPVSFKCYSTMNKSNVTVRFYGYHKLRFSHTGPMDSTTAGDGFIEWDGKKISLPILIDLMRFSLSPFNPGVKRDTTERSRHGKAKQLCLAIPERSDWGTP